MTFFLVWHDPLIITINYVIDRIVSFRLLVQGYFPFFFTSEAIQVRNCIQAEKKQFDGKTVKKRGA